MNGKRNQRDQEELHQLLETEFLVYSDTWERADVEKAERALAVYENVEDFPEQSGWGRNNQELTSEKYLTKNHICRWVKNKFVYFSRIIWDIERGSRLKKGERITKGIQIVFVGMMCAVMIISAIALMGKINVLTREQRNFEKLKSQVKVIGTNRESGGDIIGLSDGKDIGKQEILPEFRELYEENKDFCGWITIEGTKIDYPVMQSLNDREFYLHRDFYGEDSFAGVPFVGNGDIGNVHGDLFIYGHNMKSGTMFGDLLNYRNNEYWEEHPVIQFDTLWEHREYEIFTAFYAAEDDWSKTEGIFYEKINEIGMDKKEYLRRLKNAGFYETGIMPEEDNLLIFLVICSYQEKNGRLVVVGMYD